MLRLLALVTLLLTGADHWTTYLCLRRPIAGWEVVEANPLADWLFNATGLLPGLVIDSFITAIAIAFILTTPRLGRAMRYVCLVFMTGATGYAVINNLQALSALGLSPLGVG